MPFARFVASILCATFVAYMSNGAIADERKKSQAYQVCQDVESSIPDSAQNSFSPLPQKVLRHLKAPRNISNQWLANLNATVTEVEAPKHGKIFLLDEKSFHYTYTPEHNYVGKDRVVFLVQAKGQRFEVTINFLVLDVVWEQISQCRHEDFSGLSSMR